MESLATVTARVSPPVGIPHEAIVMASIKAAELERQWRMEAELIWPHQPEQQKFHILRSAVKARDAILGRDR